MRVLLATWGSRGDVEPMIGFAMALRERSAEVRMCAPPDFTDLLARTGVPMVPAGRSVRGLLVQGQKATPADAPRVAAELVAAQFDTVHRAASAARASRSTSPGSPSRRSASRAGAWSSDAAGPTWP
jgi:vancomycin aglycone glucosyltransferase